MSKSALKRSLSLPASDSSPSPSSKRTKTFQLPESTFGLFVKPIHASAGDLYDCEDTEFDELRITDYNCTFLKDFKDIAKKGDVADSIHHNLEYGIMEITINDKIYRIKIGHFFHGEVQVTKIGSDQEWDGSMANIQ